MPSMEANIISVFKSATAYQLEVGLNWYSDARGICDDIALAHGISEDTAYGIFAALSPQNGYGANVNLARRFVATGGTMTTGYLALGLGKARDIHGGADVESTLKGKNALKTLNFYRSIRDAGKGADVCVDRHAACIARGTREGTNAVALTTRRYETIATAYQRAARALGYSAQQVQAVTWVVWRQRYWSEGAFDPKA